MPGMLSWRLVTITLMMSPQQIQYRLQKKPAKQSKNQCRACHNIPIPGVEPCLERGGSNLVGRGDESWTSDN